MTTKNEIKVVIELIQIEAVLDEAMNRLENVVKSIKRQREEMNE